MEDPEAREPAGRDDSVISRLKRGIACPCIPAGLKREGRLFVKVTAMHGVRRWWETKGKLQKMFWLTAVLVCFGGMIGLIVENIKQYRNDNGSTKVTHHLESAGIQMPKITFCYNHPIKKSSIGQFNKSGEMTDELLRYIILSNKDPTKIGKTKNELELLDSRFSTFKNNYGDLKFAQFFEETGFTCEDLFKNCSFAGVKIECCKDKTLFHTSLTEMGLCHTITVNRTKQTTETDSGGLQLILDSQRDDTSPMPIEPNKIFNYPLSEGFRIFYEEPTMRTYISSHGISVVPGQSLFSGIQKNEYVFKEGCSDEGATIDSEIYRGKDCRSKCLAKAYNDHCNCAPLVFDINSEYPTCTPKEAFECSNRDEVKKEHNMEENTGCEKCKPECKRYDYQSFNSYGGPLSQDAVRALKTKHRNESETKIQKDYVVVTIYYRELSSIVYQAVDKPNWTSLLSNIGGTAGLCLGFSALTFIEIVVFLVKVLFYLISCCFTCCGRQSCCLPCCERSKQMDEKGIDYKANKQLERAAIDRLKEHYKEEIDEIARHKDEVNVTMTGVEPVVNDTFRGDEAAPVDSTLHPIGDQGLEPDAPNVNESAEGRDNAPGEEDLDVTQTTDQSGVNDTSRGDDQLDKTQSPTPPH